VLSHLDDSPWHQTASTFDHVFTSDVRFFDRLWFAASDRRGRSALQFTLGFYQNMNVVDGGVVVIVDGKQHNVRVSRQLRPTFETRCGPLSFEVLEPMQRLRLSVAPNEGNVSGELIWTATMPAQEERVHFARSWGRILEEYSRYDQTGSVSGTLDVAGTTVELDDWWACRDHSWGVRERVGVPDPYTGEVPSPGASMFAFLFYSTDDFGGHVQASRRGGSSHMTAEIIDRHSGARTLGTSISMTASFVDTDRPRRFDRVTFDVTDEHGGITHIEAAAQGPAVAMPGLGYGGYNDNAGLGAYRGLQHIEHEVWDVSHPAVVGLPDGTRNRPMHRIQPVSVTQTGPNGTSQGNGSLTFIAEIDLEPDGTLAVSTDH
jgi:hypothetical protein